MRLTQESTAGINVVRAYSNGELRINDQRIQASVIVSAQTLSVEPTLIAMMDLTDALATTLRAMDPELVLLGTGSRQIFPSAAFSTGFLAVGIGFESMDTGAACRTFNVLVAERRRVVAVLLL
jgi:uncharacterized protein